jgi:Raf kinase inhibitor-like YbhB/YbcL family protein
MDMSPWRAALFATAVGCGGSDLHALAGASGKIASITLTSRSFGENATIPIDNTCDGKDASPELTWSSPPEGTKTLALVLEDTDASSSSTQWLVYNLPSGTTKLLEGGDVWGLGAKMGLNDSPDVRYAGPCPPRGELHRYVFRIFAIDTTLNLPDGAHRRAFDAALNHHLIGEGRLTGTAAR